MNIIALTDKFTREKKIEIAFITIFSVLIIAIFYTVISMNGVVLGNDPAVHLEKAKIFLETGKIPLVNLGWTPPLYEIMLAMFISLSGASDIGQLIFMVKVLTVIVNWLMFMAVYLIGSRFFSKKIGAVAAVLLLMCFPIYELNQWGGQTTVLGIAFLMLLLLYLPLSIEKFGYLLVTFFVAFSVVLSHQLATFLAVLILPPILIYLLIKSRGAYLKVLISLIVGGGVAFFLYYFQAMIGYVDIIIEHLFFSQKTYAYQIGAASLNSFIVNFGFILILCLGGFFFAFKTLRASKKTAFYIVLFFSFLVPFVLSESNVFGLYLPFQWFIYYLTPPMAVLAAVSVDFLAEKVPVFYAKHRTSFRKNWIKAVTIFLIVLVSLVIVVRAGTVYGKIIEASVFYSTTDIKAYDAGIWLRDNYAGNTKIVATEVPGFWFQEFSDKNVIAQTNPIIERNTIAESVLTLSYELEHPKTLVKAYEAKGDISDENYVSLNNVWERISYSSASGNKLSFTQDGIDYEIWLSALSKQIIFDDQNPSKKIELVYSNENISLTETVLVQNITYPLIVSWTLTPLKSEVTNASLYLSTFFDLQFRFDKAQILQFLDWVNPWSAPEPIRTVGPDWAVANFSGIDLKDNYLGLYDATNNLAFAFKFNDLPDWGNIGALENRQIDAVRFQYQFKDLNVNQTDSRSYQVLTLSKNSFAKLQPESLIEFFDFKSSEFVVASRDFSDYIKENEIGFIVYDRNQLDIQMVHSKLLQLVYSNDRYAIFKIIK